MSENYPTAPVAPVKPAKPYPDLRKGLSWLVAQLTLEQRRELKELL